MAKFQKIRGKVIFFLLGVITTVALIMGVISFWNPEGNISDERQWYNQRVISSQNMVNKQLVKLNETTRQADIDASQMIQEANRKNPDQTKMLGYSGKVKSDLIDAGFIVADICKSFRAYIESDPKDKAIRGGDPDRLCLIINGYHEGLDYRKTAVDALYKGDVNTYDLSAQLGNEKITTAIKAIGEFESTPFTTSD
jgi:hypothetical protein